MRILYIVAGMGPTAGGLAETVLKLACEMAARGHAVTLATVARREDPLFPAAEKAMVAGVRIVRFAPFLKGSWRFSSAMLCGLGRLASASDRVHVNSNWTFPVWWGCRCAWRGGRPLIMSPHGCLEPERLRHSVWKKRMVGFLDRYYLRRADVIHATCEIEAEGIREFLKNGSSKVLKSGTKGDGPQIAVIPLGVDFETVLPCKSFKTIKSGVQETIRHTKTVLFLGRLHPLKGLDLLVEAWGRLARSKDLKCGGSEVGERGSSAVKVPEDRMVFANFRTSELQNYTSRWHLLIVGPDEQGTLKRLQAQVGRLGIADSVTFCEPIYGHDKYEMMASADLFVLPTRNENFGIVVAEALAAGVPVITTRGAPWSELLGNAASVTKWQDGGVAGWQGGREMPREESSTCLANLTNPSITANGRCGWWVEVGVEPLAEALREAMGVTDEERCTMGENGRRLVEAKYRWPMTARAMEKVYEGCARSSTCESSEEGGCVRGNCK